MENMIYFMQGGSYYERLPALITYMWSRSFGNPAKGLYFILSDRRFTYKSNEMKKYRDEIKRSEI